MVEAANPAHIATFGRPFAEPVECNGGAVAWPPALSRQSAEFGMADFGSALVRLQIELIRCRLNYERQHAIADDQRVAPDTRERRTSLVNLARVAAKTGDSHTAHR